MSGIQNFFRTILPAFVGESIKGKESREWMLKCNNCGSKNRLGARRHSLKAAGNPTRRMLCTSCGTLSAHTTYKKLIEFAEFIEFLEKESSTNSQTQ